MKRPSFFAYVFASLLLALTTVAAACGSTKTNPLGTGASGPTSSGTITGGTGAGGGQGGSGGSSSSGGSCKPGGSACQAFNECCSGVCANQKCTNCGADGQACGADGCCRNGRSGAVVRRAGHAAVG